MTGKGLRGESPELKPTVPLTDPGAALRQRLPQLDLWVWLPCLESQHYYEERTQILIKDPFYSSLSQLPGVEFLAVGNCMSGTMGDTRFLGFQSEHVC